ncbi:MAG: tRNA pseudouridine(13) synthase TruD [Myxococcales bacterium]|nr:tRNA pseudouridine(13) synthase TruD [Myxococcales bacterium]MCB9578542.1 tRNA pseudouridine(13) synthase TruD [Polyangiaceae bacterium]
MTPQEPELACADLPAVGGRIGPEPEDFVVDEVLDREPSGSGEHLFVRIEKRVLNTQDAVHAVARAAGVRAPDVGSAGMKDKHAVTRQWLSLPPGASDPGSWQLPEGLSVVESTRNEKKLRTGQLSGNRFRIRLHEANANANAACAAIVARIVEQGLPNYFGAQRFGIAGQNLDRALHWLRSGDAARGRGSRFHKKLYPSVIQSEIFNRYLTRRRALGLSTLLVGEVVRLDGSNSVFVVEEPERELPRLTSKDIHLTGPMPGPKMKKPSGVPAELEAAVLGELELSDDLLSGLARHAPGTRRDLLVFPEGLEARVLDANVVELSFFLPSGSYATELVRQLTRAPFLEPRRDRDR